MSSNATQINSAGLKEPQDHKPKASEVKEEPRVGFEDVAGHEFLTPFADVDVEDQLELSQHLIDIGLVHDDQDPEDSKELDLKSLDLTQFAYFIRYLRENFVVDVEGFSKFAKGPGAMQRVMQLAVAYAGELGNAAA